MRPMKKVCLVNNDVIAIPIGENTPTTKTTNEYDQKTESETDKKEKSDTISELTFDKIQESADKSLQNYCANTQTTSVSYENPTNMLNKR